jgi:hypothetical protein
MTEFLVMFTATDGVHHAKEGCYHHQSSSVFSIFLALKFRMPIL